MRNVDLHAINYFFLAASFFAFHLLFAYLVDRIPVEDAFIICSLVTLFVTMQATARVRWGDRLGELKRSPS